MDEVQNYTDKLRKTYRQSLDVILPFTNHEVVVYCNDDEFESFLEEQHSVKDLQACIYLLERHIDLQQEIIQGLTHLQEVHRLDEQASEYKTVTDKLLTAQNKLASLRSRTVRCLTKQIQQRYGDSNMELPAWSDNAVQESSQNLKDHSTTASNEIPTSTAQLNNPQSEVTTLLKSENLNRTLYENFNGFEKTYEEISEFREIDDAFEEHDAQNKISQTESRKVYENNEEQQLETATVEKCSELSKEETDPQEDKIFTNVERENPLEKDAKCSQDGQGESMVSNTSPVLSSDKVNDDSDKQHLASSKQGTTGVQLFLNVSKSGEVEGQDSARVSCRHILEPVEESVTVELLTTKSNEVQQVSEKLPAKPVENGPNAFHENNSHADTAEKSTDRCDGMLKSEAKEPSSKSIINTLNWDPSPLIKKILGKVKPIRTETLEADDSEEIHMAGYMEKLPVNQRKATLLKGWRKRYFKILHGKLFYFEDHRAASPISFIKLGGCQVVEIGSKCLEIIENEDLGGKKMIIRCGSWPELQDWRKALENEAKTKIKRQHFELVQEKKSIIIIDFGSSSIKAGFLEDQAWPQVIIPSVYAVNKENSKIRFYGYEALRPEVRHASKLVYPLRSPLTIGKYLLDPNDLIGFLEIIFKELQIDPSHYQVVTTTPANLRDQDKERLVEIFFDHFQVSAVFMKCQAILAMYSYSATSGVVVNIGDHIDVVPVEEGYTVESGMKSFSFGGRLITDQFTRLLSSSGYRYFSDVENYIAEYLKVKTCYVAQDFAKETEFFTESDHLTVDMSEFKLPSGDRMVTVARERFTAFEGLFKPELWGRDTPGLAGLVYDAVMACSIDSRKEMCRNIYLSGATTKIPGFAERLEAEVSRKFPSSLVVQVHAAPDRQFATFLGAAVLASLDSFGELCITREDWEETGPELLKKWDRA